ncbi:hypothetical protein C3E99_13310 [Sphingopyxis sp. MG]|jgi:hypothetical protein|nr:hypothetical protein BWD40_08975 [Sphingopyxis granuli]AVA14704.1 hypothetical protein C3E99_13310 [Sphingopyxis sp. MG]
MCLNQLLEEEQIALMRYSAATKPSEVMRYRRKIESLGRRFKPFPYRHRPYFSQNVRAGAIASARPQRSDEFSYRMIERKDV